VYETVRAPGPFRRELVLIPAGIRIQDHPDVMIVTILCTLLSLLFM